MGFFSQLGLLLWKNVLLQKHKILVSVFEILLPVLFAVLILIIRNVTKAETYPDPTSYSEYSARDFHVPYGFGNGLQLGFTPDTPLTRKLMEKVFEKAMDGVVTFGPASRFPVPAINNTYGVKGFSREADMVDYYKLNSNKMPLAVVFNGLTGLTSLPQTVSFYIRPKTGDNQRWRTSTTYPFYQQGGPRSGLEPDYKGSGVLMLQSFLAETIIGEWQNGTNVTLDLKMQRMPYPPYVSDPMVLIIQQQLPLFLILSFILSVVQSTKNIVYEKERKLKESMKLMGLMPSAHWASWFITCYIYLVVAMAIYALLFGINIIKASGPVLAFSDPSLFYVFLLCYACSIVTFCFMISAVVQKANIGAAVSGVMFFAFYLPNFFLNSRYDTMSSPQKLAACLLFNQAMAFGANVIGLYEGTGEGARWSNFHKTASVDDNFTLLDSMIMLLIDSVIHLIITWYLDNVRPGEFGVPKPFYFCFTRSYWCGPRKGGINKYENGKIGDESRFERDPVGLNAGIRICDLRKVYGKNKVAVDNLSLTMYEGQITVLLGHNGAGKTTTMSMLTGFIPPTSGTAYINEKDIRTDIDSVRESLGLCPQHNILFGTLSVEEHLTFFAKLKGCPAKRVKEEVDTMIREVGLEQKRNSPARTLSGGQKRKLSVGIALINGSKIVVLDEPSSGMDPAARRQIWDVLQRHRAGRTMLLTTHFMDEADLLGDRIAIMAEGVVKCCGTSMFLKKLYGAGYHLVIVKTPDCKVSRLTELIQSAIPTAQFEAEINAEISYLLPDDQSARFADLLRDLENQKEDLGIVNFGATATTMEEVFLKVGESASTEEDDKVVKLEGIVNDAFDQEKLVTNGTNGVQNGVQNGEQSRMQSMGVATEGAALDVLAFSRGYDKLSGLPLQLSRLRGVLVKKAIHFWRNRVITLVQLLLPVVFTIVALAVDKARPQSVTEPALAFNLNPFGGTTIPYSNGSIPNATSNAVAKMYHDQFDSSHSLPKVDVTQRSMDDYLVGTAESLGTNTYNKRVIVGAEFNSSMEARAWYNGQTYHAEPISLSFMLNALAKHAVSNKSVSMAMGVNPFPKNEDAQAERNQLLALGTGFSVGFCISIGMAFLTTSFIYFLIKERTSGAKHMQVVSGIGPVVFWMGNLIWDYINYLLPSLLLLVVFAVYGTEAYVGDGRLGIVTLLLVMFGWAILPFIYLVHFLFSSPPTGMVVIIVFNIFSGLITMTTVFVMELIPDVNDLGQTLNWVFLALFPNHCMARSFMEMYTNYLYNDICTTFNYTVMCNFTQHPCCKGYGQGCSPDSDVCFDFTEDYMRWEAPGIGRYLVFMALHGAVFLALTLMVEYNIIQRLCNCFSCFNRRARSTSGQPFFINGDATTSEDDDVAAERRRINASPASVLSQRDSLLLVNLFKQYGNFVAVDHTCVGVPEQECFGLLGQNGAGKTTTFKMLTGDVPVTGGNAYLKSWDVKNNIKRVQANMGYCPQFDALIDQMTGRETLTMYARLRGVPESNIKNCVNSLIDVLLLRPHADKLTSDYSGGNKRKLSTAMALIGDPPFILLDEPSSGMDPGARRQLWNVLSAVRASGRTLVLTSHSMEECEALCTRIAIMVNGRFVCLGSTQHLKSKFGQGYTLEARMATLENGYQAPIEPLVAYIHQCFPSAKLFDSHQGYVHMQVPDPNVRLADVFEVMERTKNELHVQDYNVHQTTLEQVFLAFTRVQTPPKESSNKSCLKRFCCCCC
ncbi:phospholipid-transporting ATPase ABCA3-like [Littorina saxatilis]|uniref:ABC transporter domain-containing protein n=1 Tax=Littorina saxatilis TaxID=31220 RepID=A0AAN9BCA9_9CAEN